MSEQSFSEHSFCCLRVQRQRHPVPAPFSQISPPAQLRHRRTLVTHRRSRPRRAAARVCFGSVAEGGVDVT